MPLRATTNNDDGNGDSDSGDNDDKDCGGDGEENIGSE